MLNNGVVLLVTRSLFTLPELLSPLSLMLLNMMSLLQHFAVEKTLFSFQSHSCGHEFVMIK